MATLDRAGLPGIQAVLAGSRGNRGNRIGWERRRDLARKAGVVPQTWLDGLKAAGWGR